MKVLILGDGQGWIVDRVVARMAAGMPYEFTQVAYTGVSSRELFELALEHELVHYGNWDLRHHLEVLGEVVNRVPFVLTVRSHRYAPYVKVWARRVTCCHVVNPRLAVEFPGSVFIPTGISEFFCASRPFVVGFAGRPSQYKGFDLIRQACEELGAKFAPATGGIPPERMVEYYQSIDVYVCASEAEGFSTPVMECMAMNVPVVTTQVGIPASLNVIHVERSVEGIKEGIGKLYTSRQVLPAFSWERVNDHFRRLYLECVKKWKGEECDLEGCAFHYPQ